MKLDGESQRSASVPQVGKTKENTNCFPDAGTESELNLNRHIKATTTNSANYHLKNLTRI